MATPDGSLFNEPAVFGTSIEALVDRALGGAGKLDEPTRQVLRDLKIDLKNLRTAYDYGTWVQLLTFLTGHMYPSLSEEQAYFQLGKDYLNGLEKTLIGKAIFAMGRMVGPVKMLERMTRNVRTANNYMESVLEPQPDGSYKMVYRVVDALLPAMKQFRPPSTAYFHGILQAALEASGAKEISVVKESHDVEKREAVFRLKFKA